MKIHYKVKDENRLYCNVGSVYSNIAKDPNDVTCKKCIDKLEKAGILKKKTK